MLNIKDIISLANAGYTAEQIDEMQRQDEGQDAGQQQQDAGQQQQQDVGQQQGNAQSPISERILKELEDMRAALQSSNIGASRQPSNDSLDEVLASIISPKPNFDK